ncbi:MAG: ABC transporter ATP-binding protein/permease [Oscillospiraceae bacterium]|nr:ABC transporter ATP-binding protein/permease [Oscillospiraceae bacterium]
MPMEKAKDFKGSMKQLFKRMAAFKGRLILIFLAAIGSTVFSIVGPKILGTATTELFNGLVSKMSGGNGIAFDKIAEILLFVLALYIVSALLSAISGWIMADVAQTLAYRLGNEISAKIHRMPFRKFDSTNTGETLSIITNDIDTLAQGLNQSFTSLVTSFVSLVGISIMMFTINWKLTLIVLIILPLSGVIMGFMMKHSHGYFATHQEYLGHVNAQIEEVFGAQTIVRAYNAEDKVTADFDEDNERLYTSAWKSQFISGLMMPIMFFIGNIGYVAVAAVGGYLAVTGSITVGSIQAFIQYVKQFTQPLSQVAQASTQLQSLAAAAERIFAFLGEEEEASDEGKQADVSLVKGNITFEHVHFGYSDDKVIIKDFSANVKAGQKIAIVGATGAGKTTVIKLLMRFYEVQSGKITADGIDLRDFRRHDIRQAFGMVLQDTWVFGGTIMENIRYGKDGATDEEVIAAAKTADAHHFIMSLPNGYSMELNEESSNISSGQKQLLTIARAVLADPKILILDEATSSVDTMTEEKIQQAMDVLMRGRTSFIIAHRLSTIRNADLILHMKDGDITEQGTHEELLARGGDYAVLYNSQFEKV